MSGRTARPNPSSQPLLQQPSSPYSRAPPDTSVRYGDPHRRPPANSQRSYYDSAPPEKRGYSQGQSRQGPEGQKRQLIVIKNKSERLTYGNLVAVSPDDFPEFAVSSVFYVILKGKFVCTAVTSSEVISRYIMLSDPQRTWTVTSEGLMVDVEKYNPFQEGGPPYLGWLEVDVSFGVGKKPNDTEHDEDGLQQHFTTVCKEKRMKVHRADDM